MDRIYVGLIGFGTIGTGVVKLLDESSCIIKEKVGMEIILKKIADKDISRDRGIKIGRDMITMDPYDIINDDDISIVIELIGGTDSARRFIMDAIERGKSVVTANKALLSIHGSEIFQRTVKKGVDIGFEASVGGGIPIIRAIKEGFAADRITSMYGIINGTANYILSKMTEDEGRGFREILKDAQRLGYAEADPTYDVDGIDTAHKLAILVNLAYGSSITPDKIYTEGIGNITPLDIRFAREFGYRIKLLAIAKESGRRIEARVHPTMIPEGSQLAKVGGVYNAIHLTGSAVGSVVLYGQGAGMMPTASAVVSDVIDIVRNIRKGISCRIAPLSYLQEGIKPIEVEDIKELEVPYYIRFSAVDKPGVLSKISGVLGNYGISISSVIQKGRRKGGAVPVVIITHYARERQLLTALDDIDRMDVIHGRTQYIRIEEKLGADE